MGGKSFFHDKVSSQVIRLYIRRIPKNPQPRFSKCSRVFTVSTELIAQTKRAQPNRNRVRLMSIFI